MLSSCLCVFVVLIGLASLSAFADSPPKQRVPGFVVANSPPSWIWAGPGGEKQTVYLRRTFELKSGISIARLIVAADDKATVYLDGEEVLATGSQLEGASVSARVVGEAKGPKIKGFTYKNKSNQRRRWGHRQHYSTIEITAISKS